ncbi:hypothetical protein BJ508DRAFT_238080 [Ascobolus immersus RN42]|uniref:Uncharacterized protein n=1 Tax=Ascobolus immersus RN42 TaxID=1160509 RepID=A0A3N4IE29_ASCIM|nr:hypothetical protein BJ508DRAFT_238080 [Ascobolus immersus RN42]
MRSSTFLLFLFSPLLALAQDTSEGYTGYNLTITGDEESVIYETASTPALADPEYPPPDVFLNASVHVGEISILVQNLTAKINLDAQVLNLLEFNAGVDAHVDSVRLLIQNVTAKVLLEARLANLVAMVSSVLDSLDLNPLVGTIGKAVGEITDGVGDILNPSSSSSSSEILAESEGRPTLEARGFKQDLNILYSVNDYSGNAHTNRVLLQNGEIYDQFLRNDGLVYDEKRVGHYEVDMRFNGFNETVVRNGREVTMEEWVYAPFVGLEVLAAVYTEGVGNVVETRILAETSGGGSSTIAAEDD